jgi:hypothetical protein
MEKRAVSPDGRPAQDRSTILSKRKERKMAKLECRQTQRTASGYNFYYRDVENPDYMVSAETMIAYRSYLVDPMDADEWREWESIQVENEPFVPSPRKWVNGMYRGRTVDEQKARAEHMRQRLALRELPTYLATREEAESLAAFITANYPSLQVEVREYKPTYADLRYQVYAWPQGRPRGLDYHLFEVSDSGCRFFYDCSLHEFVQRTIGLSVETPAESHGE